MKNLSGFAWLNARIPLWNGLSSQAQSLQRRPARSVPEALALVDGYRSVARDLSMAETLSPGSRTAAGLRALQYRLHGLVHRHPPAGWRGAWELVRDGVPRAAREIAAKILWTGALMAGGALAGWWLISTYPTLISLVASEAMIEHVESGKLWTDGLINVMPSSLLSAQILSNNIVVSLFAVCSGVLFGLGTFYLIGLNGFMLGAVFAFVHQHGLGERLFEFIVAHGMVELSVICIAGAMGAAIGDSLIRPTHSSRRESFHSCVTRLAPLMAFCALLLIGAGTIEGFISPDPAFPLWSRVTIGALYWLLMVLALSGRWRRI
jgi:uncharacterized membrane protein SpoIIM required for sporulation